MQVMTANENLQQHLKDVPQQSSPQTTMQLLEQNDVAPGFQSQKGFELLLRMGKMVSAIDIIPDNYRGKIPECAIAVEMAKRVDLNPLEVMQNLYIVYGKPGWSSSFLIREFNRSGLFSRIRYKTTGEKGKDSYGVIAWAVELATGEKLIGPEVTVAMAKQEGWYQKKGSKWQTMPDLMLRYRAASFFIRTTAPDVVGCLKSQDELEDMYQAAQQQEKQVNIPAEEIKTHANKKTIDVAAVSVDKEPPKKEAPKVEKTAEPSKAQQQKKQEPEDTELFNNPDDLPDWGA